MKLDDELEFGLEFLRDDGYLVGDPQVSGNIISYPVNAEMWPESKIRDIARQAAEAELERSRGEVLAQHLAVNIAATGASGATHKVIADGRAWIVSAAVEGTEAPPAVNEKKQPKSIWTPYRKDKRA